MCGHSCHADCRGEVALVLMDHFMRNRAQNGDVVPPIMDLAHPEV